VVWLGGLELRETTDQLVSQLPHCRGAPAGGRNRSCAEAQIGLDSDERFGAEAVAPARGQCHGESERGSNCDTAGMAIA
jgi:hypothetical protein